jgi:hypothetical protein
MVKEIILSKTETVYEMKDEIPSYEEFLKNWKRDEVSESYESEINASDDLGKGYGPCDICGKDEAWMDFKMSCPAKYCTDNSPDYWYHASFRCLGSRMEISNKGILRCKGCRLAYNMANWEFACSEHGGGYREMNEDSWRKAMGDALRMPKSDRITNQVIMQLNIYVTNHPEKFGFSSF